MPASEAHLVGQAARLPWERVPAIGRRGRLPYKSPGDVRPFWFAKRRERRLGTAAPAVTATFLRRFGAL